MCYLTQRKFWRGGEAGHYQVLSVGENMEWGLLSHQRKGSNPQHTGKFNKVEILPMLYSKARHFGSYYSGI